MKKQTDEEKVALFIGKIVCDLRIDLDQIGMYIARYLPAVAYRRFMLIAEAAQEERENNGRNKIR